MTHPTQNRGLRHTLFWCFAILLIVLFFYVFEPVLQPFIFALIIAYLLDPLTDKLETRGIPRWAASLSVLVGATAILLSIIFMFAPLIASQLVELAQAIPGILVSLVEKVKEGVNGHLKTYLPQVLNEVDDISKVVSDLGVISDLGPQIGSFLKDFLGRIFGAGLQIFDFIAILVITPVVAFYVLRDWDRIVGSFYGLLPKNSSGVIREQLGLIDQTLSGFFRGQSLVCITLGMFYAIGLTLCGLKFGFIIGIIAGVITFIPYLGSIIGLGLSMVVAFSQWDQPLPIIMVAVVFFVGQFLEGNVLTPKLVGDRVGLHPVWIMFAIMAGGSLFGFIGVLVAVPVAASVGVLIRFFTQKYLKSEFHLNAKTADQD